jgi:hypothetical protein
MGEDLQGFTTIDSMSVCFKGQDGMALDPWVHRHRLGRLQPTLESTSCPNNRLTCHATAIGWLLAFLNVATKNKVLNLISSNDARNAYWYLLMTWKNK